MSFLKISSMTLHFIPRLCFARELPPWYTACWAVFMLFFSYFLNVSLSYHRATKLAEEVLWNISFSRPLAATCFSTSFDSLQKIDFRHIESIFLHSLCYTMPHSHSRMTSPAAFLDILQNKNTAALCRISMLSLPERHRASRLLMIGAYARYWRVAFASAFSRWSFALL